MQCRVCEGSLNQRIFQLKEMPLTDEFVMSSNRGSEYIADIEIFQCAHCGLTQNPQNFNHESYYESYEYSSGHSMFSKAFMLDYARAAISAFESTHERPPTSVLEVGSGDGEQLLAFAKLQVRNLLGVEPSGALVKQSESRGISAHKGLFGKSTVAELAERKFDICISSYTLDHVRSPAEYLQAAYALLSDGGILAFEVHDFALICARTEWCLFEHEHTIYMDANMACALVERYGFDVQAVNPLPTNSVRANSLIVIARKSGESSVRQPRTLPSAPADLQARVSRTIERIDAWIESIPAGTPLVGYGAGGRGVMTLAALRQYSRFEMIFDSNYTSDRYLTPRTHIPVSGLESLPGHATGYCLVFSFGYLEEITKTLLANGFSADRIVPLNAFYEGTHRKVKHEQVEP